MVSAISPEIPADSMSQCGNALGPFKALPGGIQPSRTTNGADTGEDGFGLTPDISNNNLPICSEDYPEDSEVTTEDADVTTEDADRTTEDADVTILFEQTSSTPIVEYEYNPMTTDTYQDPIEQSAIFFNNTIKCSAAAGNCSKVFYTSRNFRLHLVKHHNLPRYRCIVCSKPFEIYNELKEHMTSSNHAIQCTACTQSFTKVHDAGAHFTLKHKVFVCLYCTDHIYGKISFKNHLEKYHDAEENCHFSVSSFAETTLNSSFSEPHSGPLIEAEEPLNEESDFESLNEEPELGRDAEVNGQCQRAGRTWTLTPLSHCTGTSSRWCIDQPSTAPEVEDSSSRLGSDSDIMEVDSGTREVEERVPDSDSEAVNTNIDNEFQSRAMFRNPFYQEQVTCPVVFGPGADELLEGSSEVLSPVLPSSSNDQDGAQWIGHDVNIYQSAIEKHKNTFRFACKKCSSSFRTKEMLKRHLKVHEFICKECFENFDSHQEYKAHRKTHILSTYRTCAMCRHKVVGIKNFMVHELRHRLNEAFRQKLEKVVESEASGSHGPSPRQCKQCNKGTFSGFPDWLRHQVWHDWPMIWTKYVRSRVLTCSFSVNDVKKFKKPVEDELLDKWVVGFRENNVTLGGRKTSKRKQCDLEDTLLEEDSSIDSDNHRTDTLDTETDTSSEVESNISEAGVRIAVDGWMSYWSSYIGLDGSSPLWVKPILKELRAKWKLYHSEDHDSLYRQMDQIAILVRAQKNRNLSAEEPKVILQRLPESYVAKLTCHPSKTLPEAKVVLGRLVEEDFVQTNCSSPLLQSCLASSSPSSLNQYDNSSEVTPRLSKTCKPPGSKLFSDIRLHMRSRTVRSSTKNPARRFQNKSKKSCVNGAQSRSSEIKIFQMSEDSLNSSGSATQDQTLNVSASTLTSPKSGFGQPLVVLERLSSTPDTKLCPNVASSEGSRPMLELPSSFQEVDGWIKKQMSTQDAPAWALPLLKNIWCNDSLSGGQKKDKFYQIIHLVKAELGETSVKMPFISLSRV